MAKTIVKSKRKGEHEKMKKADQLFYNEAVVDMYNEMKRIRDNCTLVYTKRLRQCQAWVYCFKDEKGELYYMLRSYGTMVAGITPQGYKFDWLRYAYFYTATSAQHIAKFFNDYGAKGFGAFRYYPV